MTKQQEFRKQTEEAKYEAFSLMCKKVADLEKENAELKKKLKEKLKTIADKDLSFVAKFDALEKENAELKKKCYKKAVKDYCELEKENEQLKSVAELQQSSNMKRHFEIQKLKKENAKLKAQIEKMKCCGNCRFDYCERSSESIDKDGNRTFHCWNEEKEKYCDVGKNGKYQCWELAD